MSDLSFLRKSTPTTAYTGLKATCAVTGHPWREDYAGRVPDIRLPAQIVYRDHGTGAKPIVHFRQTGPGALGGSLDVVQVLFGDTMRKPLSRTLARASGRYSSGGDIHAAVELHRVGNTTYVCGVWRERRGPSPRTEKQAPEVLARGAVLIDGKPLLQDLRFLRRVTGRGSLHGKTATCMDTGQDWRTLSSPGHIKLQLPRMVVYWGPGARITFAPDHADS